VTAARGLALAAAHGVIDGVHGHAAHPGLLAHPAAAARLADAHALVGDVAHLADRGLALDVDLADLAGGKPHLGVGALLGHELGVGAGGADHLGPLAGPQLDVVDERPQGDVAQGHRVAGLDVGRGARDDRVAHLEVHGGHDVALLAVGVAHQRDPRRAVGVVLDRLHRGRDVRLVAAEVHHAVLALVPAAAVAARHASRVVASARLLDRLREALLGLCRGDLLEGRVGLVAPGRCRGLHGFDRHGSFPLS